MFHVKHRSIRRRYFWRSLPNAKITEDDVQNILDINPPCQPTKRSRGGPQFLGDQFLAAGSALGERTIKIAYRFIQCASMTLAGYQNGLSCTKEFLGKSRKLPY